MSKRVHFLKKSKAIDLRKIIHFLKNFFVLEANLLASVWLLRSRIAFSVDEKDVFLDKKYLLKRVQFLKKSKAIALEKSSIFEKIFVVETNLLASVWLLRSRIAFSVGEKDVFLTKNHCRRGSNF